MSDIPLNTQAFLSVMREQPDYVIFRYLASTRESARKGALIDEGDAREYVLLLTTILEDERHIPPDTIQEVLADTQPLSGREYRELFDKRIGTYLKLKER